MRSLARISSCVWSARVTTEFPRLDCRTICSSTPRLQSHPIPNQSNPESGSRRNHWTSLALLVGGGSLVLGTSYLKSDEGIIYAEEEKEAKGKTRVFRQSEVSEHDNKTDGIWVTHGTGVYDITNFVNEHPGGSEKIMLAAGKSVDPFWSLYTIHKGNGVVQDFLKEYYIGELDPRDIVEKASTDEDDPFSNDPDRSPVLIVHQEKPFNAEPPRSLIMQNYITPTALWYVRHHHPVPEVDIETYRLSVSSDGTLDEKLSNLSLSVADLRKNYKERTVVMTMQCAGNRRGELNASGKTQGLNWGIGAISTAEFKGVFLRDVLADLGVTYNDEKGVQHVQFMGIDDPYDASIPARKALDKYGDVLLAYEMNGEPIPREHGFPVRVLVPGTLGARSVKWLQKIVVSKEESASTWQRGLPYKGTPPWMTDFKNVDPDKLTPVQELPVQSAICSPLAGAEVNVYNGTVEVSGFAWSGGGRGIVRVDVSADGGETWHTAVLGEGSDQPLDRAWAWTFWTCDIPLPKNVKSGDKALLVCKAIDASYNSQPSDVRGQWNLRGILNNCWHRVEIQVQKDA